MTENKTEDKLSTSSLSPPLPPPANLSLPPSTVTIPTTSQFEENEKVEEKKYLLDGKQLTKFGHLLGEKKNSAFIKKAVDTPLIHSKRYFPISREEYLIIKQFIETSLEGKKTVNVSMNNSNETNIPPTTQPTLPSTSTTTNFPSTDNQITSTSTVPETESLPLPTPLPSTSLSPSVPTITAPVLSHQPKTRTNKTQVWRPLSWEPYLPKSSKK